MGYWLRLGLSVRVGEKICLPDKIAESQKGHENNDIREWQLVIEGVLGVRVGEKICLPDKIAESQKRHENNDIREHVFRIEHRKAL